MSTFNLKKSWEKNRSLLFAILAALTIRWGLLEAYVIPSGSMLPSLLIHDHIFVNKIIYGIRVPFSKHWMFRFSNPQRGDIIVFKYPEDESTFYVKRVVGIPGDVISYENGKLRVNGQDVVMKKAEGVDEKWDYEWLRPKDLGAEVDSFDHIIETNGGVRYSTLLSKEYEHRGFGPQEIPPDSYFAMGDNRDNSKDSRYWGFVPHENLLGKATFVWLSCEETLEFLPFLCNPLELRWGRFFHSVHK